MIINPATATLLTATPLATARTAPTLPTLPALVAGHVMHHRLGPVRHAFHYSVYQWPVNLDAVPEQPWYLRPFASFSAADHLGDPSHSIKANIEFFLSGNGISLGEPSRIVMLANARVLNHVFDPLSIFWCFDANTALVCIVAEVNNTYGERHVYLLRPDSSGVATTEKAFHVSPFFDVSGRYEMRFELSPWVVSSTIILHREGSTAFAATFRGRPTRVITVCPGFVRTDLTESNSFPMPFIIDADTAGRAICDGLERERTEIVFPVRMALLMKAARLVPVGLWSALWSRIPQREGS